MWKGEVQSRSYWVQQVQVFIQVSVMLNLWWAFFRVAAGLLHFPLIDVQIPNFASCLIKNFQMKRNGKRRHHRSWPAGKLEGAIAVATSNRMNRHLLNSSTSSTWAFAITAIAPSATRALSNSISKTHLPTHGAKDVSKHSTQSRRTRQQHLTNSSNHHRCTICSPTEPPDFSSYRELKDHLEGFHHFCTTCR